MSTIKRRGSASQFADVFAGVPTPIRRPETDQTPSDPGADLTAIPPPPAASASEALPVAVGQPPRRAPRRAQPVATTVPAGLDPSTRRTVDVETRRYLAARRKLDERTRDLVAAVHAATGADPRDGEIAAILAGAGLTRHDIPADIADQLTEHDRGL